MYCYYFGPWRTRILRSILVPVLCLTLVGCSAYQRVALPGGDPSVPPAEKQPPVVGSGTNVRVTLVSGQQIKGEVKEVSATSVTLSKIGMAGDPTGLQCEIPKEEIAKIEAVDASPGGKVALIVVGSVAIVLLFVANEMGRLN